MAWKGAITLITGPSGCGKSLFCLRSVTEARAQGATVGGVLSPGRYVAGTKIGIDVIDLSGNERRSLATLRGESRTIVFFESPKRIGASLKDIHDLLGDRKVVLTRELTKVFEEVRRGVLSGMFDLDQVKEKGEYTLIIEGASQGERTPTDDEIREMLMDAFTDPGTSLRDAVRENGRIAKARRPLDACEFILRGFREFAGERLLRCAEHVDGEVAGVLEGAQPLREHAETPQHQRRVQRNRGERIAGQPIGLAVGRDRAVPEVCHGACGSPYWCVTRSTSSIEVWPARALSTPSSYMVTMPLARAAFMITSALACSRIRWRMLSSTSSSSCTPMRPR